MDTFSFVRKQPLAAYAALFLPFFRSRTDIVYMWRQYCKPFASFSKFPKLRSPAKMMLSLDTKCLRVKRCPLNSRKVQQTSLRIMAIRPKSHVLTVPKPLCVVTEYLPRLVVYLKVNLSFFLMLAHVFNALSYAFNRHHSSMCRISEILLCDI